MTAVDAARAETGATPQRQVESSIRRRTFLSILGGAVGGTAIATGTATAQEANGSAIGNNTSAPRTGATQTSGNTTGNQTTAGSGGGGSATVAVGPNNEYVFRPGTDEPLRIAPGTTVTFEWESDNHNVAVDSQPDGADWQGHEPLENTGFSFSSTFDTEGIYEYHCDPHQSLGMTGTIEVTQNPSSGSGSGGGPPELNPEEMGVPLQPHYVGIVTLFAMGISLAYTFFVVKYGESPHTKRGHR